MSIAALGIDFGVLNALNLWVACLVPVKDNQAQLVSFVFHEERPDVGEIKLVSREVAGTVPHGATEVLLPWCNYSRMRSLWLWHGWVEGANLCALTSASAPLARLSLNAPPARLVRPPLAVSSGEFELPYVSAGGRELALARFVPGPDGGAPSGSIPWHVPLPGAVAAAGAALGPVKAGSPRRAVLAFQDKENVTLELLDLASGRPPPGRSNAKLSPFYILPGSEIGVRIDETGTTYVSLVVSSTPDFLDISIVDAVFPAGGDKTVVPRVEAGPKLAVPPVAAAITFQSRPDRPMRRDWAVLLSNGSLVHNKSAQKPMRPQGKPVTPLELVALSQTTYLLTLGLAGPNLEPLR